MKTYHRHLVGQWIYNFSLAFLVLNLLLLVGNLVKYGSKVGITHILPLLPALLPSMFVYSLPMAGLTATISTLSRARQLHEPITLASSGIGLFKLLPPFLWIGLSLNLLTIASFQWLQPLGESYKTHYLGNIGANLLESELNKKQSTLQLGADSLSFFERGQGIRSAVIQHRENGRITQEVFASHAEVSIDRETKKVNIHTKGSVQVLDYQDQDHFGQLQFTDFPPVQLSYLEMFSSEQRYRQWPLTKMWAVIQSEQTDNLPKLKATFYEKLCMCISPILLIIASFPLGFLGKDSSRTTGFLTGLGLIFLVYYPLLIVGKKCVIAGLPLEALYPQIPNLALLAIGYFGLKHLDKRI